tara:strand:- start:3341 stop:3478 length:138 start_codon:yes stop_codon:yes gene_type:complete
LKGVKYPRDTNGKIITAQDIATAANINRTVLFHNVKILKEILGEI